MRERFRGLMIFFIQECVCHRVTRSFRGNTFFPGKKEMSAGLATTTTALCFMGEGLPRRRDTVRDDRLEEAQPPEADHESTRRKETAIGRLKGGARPGRLSSGREAFDAD